MLFLLNLVFNSFSHGFNLGLAQFQSEETIGMFRPHFGVTAIRQKILSLNIGILSVLNHSLVTESFCDAFNQNMKLSSP